MEFIPVQSFSNYVEAHIAMGYLQQQHINCWLKDEYTVTIDPILSNAVGGIKLMVVKVQVPRAVALLKAVAKDKQRYACPYCGSPDIQQADAPLPKQHWFIALVNILLSGNAAATRQVWHCSSCGRDCRQPVAVDTATVEDAKL